MKTIYTAIPLAVLAAVAQAQEHGHDGDHHSGVHDFLGGNTEKGDFLGDTYDHDFLGDGFNEPHKKPHDHGTEQGASAGSLNVPRDGDPDFDLPAGPGFDSHDAATDINSPNFNSPTISPDINSPVSGPHNFNQQKGPHTHSGDNEVDDGINNDNIVITPVTSFQGQLASEQDNYVAPPPPPPPPHGGPPHEEGGEHGPQQLPPGQHSEPQHHVPGPPGDHPHPEGGPGPAPGPENHGPPPHEDKSAPAPPPEHQEEKPAPAPAPAPAHQEEKPSPAPQSPPQEPAHQQEPAHDGASPEHPVREFPAQHQEDQHHEEQAHPDRQGEQQEPCTFHNHETPAPPARPQPVGGSPAQPTGEAKAAPQPQFEQGRPKPLGQTPSEGEAQPPKAHMSQAAHSSAACSSARVHNAHASSQGLPHISYRVEAHSSFVVAKPSHTPSTTSAARVNSTPAPRPSSTSSAFVGGAGSVSVPQGFGMAVAGALAFLL